MVGYYLGTPTKQLGSPQLGIRRMLEEEEKNLLVYVCWTLVVEGWEKSPKNVQSFDFCA